MNLVHLRQSLSRSGRVLLPLRRWKSVQFNVLITRKRIETATGPLLCHRRISEAHAVRTANTAFGQSGPSSRQGNHSHASVRFHTTANIRG
jgi:hypothetical protein